MVASHLMPHPCNSRRGLVGSELSEAQLLPALKLQTSTWNKESARWLGTSLYNMLKTVRERLTEKLKVRLALYSIVAR